MPTPAIAIGDHRQADLPVDKARGWRRQGLSQVPPQGLITGPFFPPPGSSYLRPGRGYRLGCGGWYSGRGCLSAEATQEGPAHRLPSLSSCTEQPAPGRPWPEELPQQASRICSRHGLPLICSLHQPDRTCYFYFLILKLSGQPVIPFPGSQGSCGYFILFYFLQEWESFQRDFRRKPRINSNKTHLKPTHGSLPPRSLLPSSGLPSVTAAPPETPNACNCPGAQNNTLLLPGSLGPGSSA